MIKEEYVQHDTAKPLKEAGFPGINTAISLIHALEQVGQDLSFFKDELWRESGLPTQDQAMRWLREEHHISVEPLVTPTERWCLNVWDFKTAETIANDEVDRFPTYEAAAEAGIQAACKYIIQNSRYKPNRE